MGGERLRLTFIRPPPDMFSAMAPHLTIAIDTGGTFTDCVYRIGNRMHVLKLPSTPDDPSRAILEAVRKSPCSPRMQHRSPPRHDRCHQRAARAQRRARRFHHHRRIRRHARHRPSGPPRSLRLESPPPRAHHRPLLWCPRAHRTQWRSPPCSNVRSAGPAPQRHPEIEIGIDRRVATLFLRQPRARTSRCESS